MTILSAVTCVVKGRENNALFFFFLRKAKHCFHRETDASLLPPWLLYQRGGMVTLLSSSHCSQKAGQIIPQCYFSLSCETSIVLLLYCETVLCGKDVHSRRHTFRPLPLAVESRVHSSFSIVTGLVFSL